MPYGNCPQTRAQKSGTATVGFVFILIVELIRVYSWIVIVRCLLSFFVRPGQHNAFVDFIHAVTEPLMKPFRRLIPPIGGLDLSPMALLLALYLLQRAAARILLG